MKTNRSLILILVLFVIIASVYRVWDGRPWGFVPQMSMALFAGSLIRNKALAFLVPVASMFLSDVLYQVLYSAGLTEIPGFYEGQVLNYALFAMTTIFGFWLKRMSFLRIASASLAAPTFYFLVSNLAVWLTGGGWHRPKTFSGLVQCYADGLPFYAGSIMGTLFFSAVLFGGYYLYQRTAGLQQKTA